MTALNLPADILDAIEGYREALILRVLHRRLESAEQDAALDNLTALLSGYVEDALRWREMGATRYPPPPRTFGGSND